MQAQAPVALLLASALLAGCLGLGATSGGDAVSLHERLDSSFASFDGTRIAVTVFKPSGASPGDPAPVVVMGHGWSGSRATEIEGLVQRLLEAGIGVVTFDGRGHGASGGESRVMDPDVEVRDVAALLDWMHDTLHWATRQPGTAPERKDLVVGAAGGSYGGGWHLIVEALDGRLDALAPEITWNSLPRSLAPNDAIKSSWVHVLYSSGKARVRLDPDIDRWYAEAMATNGFSEEARAHFTASSAFPYLGNVTAPTLLVQGVPDTLFNLNEADATFDALRANGTTVRLFTHLGGHVLAPSYFSSAGPLPAPDLAFPQPADAGSPCGDVDGVVVAWFVEHLLGGPAADLPPVAMALDDGSCAHLDALPRSDAAVVEVGVPVAMPAGAGSVLVPLFTTEKPLRLAGIPVLNASGATAAGVDDILYASLVVASGGAERTLSSQVTPARLAGPGARPLALELGGVGALLDAGDELYLKLDRVNEFYATNSGRLPGALLLEGVTVALPVVAD